MGCDQSCLIDVQVIVNHVIIGSITIANKLVKILVKVPVFRFTASPFGDLCNSLGDSGKCSVISTGELCCDCCNSIT